MSQNQTITGRLLKGDDITILSDGKNNLLLKNYKIGHIFSEIGLENYNLFCNISLMEIDEADENIKGFLLKSLEEFFKVFTNCQHVKYHDFLQDYLIFFNDIDFVRVGVSDISSLFEIFRTVYCVPKKEGKYDNIVVKNERQKEMLDKFKAFDKKIQESKKNYVTLDSLVESVSVKHPSYNLLNIWDLTVYQLMKTYERIMQVDKYNHIMLGIYTGNIDSKEVKDEEINWSIKK